MADQDDDQKTELPTGKRLAEAMENGQFARAPELQVLFTLGATLAVMGFTARAGGERVAEYAVNIFTHFTKYQLRADTVTANLGDLALAALPVVAPILGACSLAAIVAGGLQSGFNLTPGALGFKWERLDPMAGFGRVFSRSVLVRAGIDLLKVAAIGGTLYAGSRTLLRDPMFTSPVESAYLIQFLYQAAMTFFGRMLFSLGVLAAISLAYEKFKTLKELRMTKQEVKDEMKNSEGDAMMKGAQRRLARRLMQRQMLAAVPTADVIITNPTHYAVALKYERGRDHAPVILAKGENRFAIRIKELAAEHSVPMVENVPVARMLYALGKVGEAIPAELYQAVAEILAVVYRTHRYYFHELKTRRLTAAL